MEEDGYEILHSHKQRDEIWLQKYNQRKPTIVRLIQRGFNWKNELKSDMARTFNIFETLQRKVTGKEIEIHNIYISTYPPVDTWEKLKEPVRFKKKKQVSMHMYYIDEEEGTNELQRLAKALHRQTSFYIPEVNIEDKEQFVQSYTYEIHTAIQKQKEYVQKTLFFGKPKLVYYLIGLNILYFLIVEFNGGSMDTETLVQFGAKYNPLIMDGEWWRLITSMFMHIGFVHLAMNMLALYYLGSAVEQIFGSKRFIGMYMFAGIGAGLASFALSSSISAGASGAIFGLFGVLLYFGLIHKKLFFQTMGSSILAIIAINLVFGFTVPMVDNSAHVGGLITGFIAASVIQLPSQGNRNIRRLGMGATAVGLAVLLWFGFNSGANAVIYELSEIEQLQEEEEYEEVIERTTDLLDEGDAHTAQILFQRSYAFIMTYEYDAALKDLEEVIEIENEMMPEAYYNAALLYLEMGDEALAEERIIKAYELQPENEDIEQLYEEMIEE